MQNEIANFCSAELVEYSPARTMVTGKTVSERRLSVLPSASFEAVLYASSRAGRVGKVARAGLAGQSTELIASKARRWDYRPLSEALAVMLGESVSISNRASFDGLADRFSDRLYDLELSKNGGYVVDKKTGLTKPNAKRKMLDDVIGFIREVQEIASATK